MLVTVTLAGCGGSGRAESDSDSTLTLGVEVSPQTWDPAMQVSSGSGVLLWQPVFDTLLKYAPDGTIVPNAAEDFAYNKDRTELTLTLRKGMTFTDGEPVDARAAKLSIEHLRDSTGPDAIRLAGVQVEVVDDHKLRLSTQEPNALLAQYLAWAPGILSSPSAFGSDSLASRPVGSGPYVFVKGESTSGDTLVFTRNPDYWNAEAYPNDKVIIRVMAEETARLNALRSGQIEAAPMRASSVAEAESAGLTLLENAVNWNGMFIFDREGSRVPALGDVRVRQAITKVFDRAAIVESIYQGHATPSNQIFDPSGEAYDESLNALSEYDVDEAKRLMAEAGYEDGFDLTLPELADRTDAWSPMIKQQLGLLNIDVTFESVPATQYLAKFLGGEYPIVPFGLPSGTPLFDVDQALAPDSIWNVFKNGDRELTALIDELQVAPEDEQGGIAREINKYVTEQAWFSVFVFADNFWAFRDGVDATPVVGNSAPYLYAFG